MNLYPSKPFASWSKEFHSAIEGSRKLYLFASNIHADNFTTSCLVFTLIDRVSNHFPFVCAGPRFIFLFALPLPRVKWIWFKYSWDNFDYHCCSTLCFNFSRSFCRRWGSKLHKMVKFNKQWTHCGFIQCHNDDFCSVLHSFLIIPNVLFSFTSIERWTDTLIDY